MARIAGVSVVLAACLALLGSTSAALGSEGLIAFTSHTGRGTLSASFGEHSRVFLMRADGSGRRLLIDDPPRPTLTGSDGPAWSPDGTVVAYDASGSPLDSLDDRTEIHTVAVDSGVVRRLTNPRGASDYDAAFSPGGDRIAFARRSLSLRKTDATTGIYAMRADGGAPVRLTNGGLDERPTWSPDGRRLAFSRVRIGPRGLSPGEIDVMNSDGSGRHRIAPAGESPAWSPDGQRIAFVRPIDRRGRPCADTLCNPNREVYVMRTNGSGITRLTRTRAADEGRPTWSADGRELVFDSDVGYGNQSEIYRMDDRGRCITRLTNTAGENYGPAWGPGMPAPAPGPCGGTAEAARTPIVETDLSAVRRARSPLFYLGPNFRGMLLTEASLLTDSPIAQRFGIVAIFEYGDCGLTKVRNCAGDFGVASASVCRLNALSGVFVGPGVTPPTYVRVAGGLAEIVHVPDPDPLPLGSRTRLVLFYTGETVVSIDHVRRVGSERIVRALRPLDGEPPAAFAPPRLPAALLRRLRAVEHTMQRVHSSRRAARLLRTSPQRVRNALALIRALRPFGRIRAARC